MNLPQIFTAIGDGVQNIKAAKCWTPSPLFHSYLRGGSKILWLHNIKFIWFSFAIGNGVQNSMATTYWTPAPTPPTPYFSNFMGEGFQNMAAKCWTLHIFIISIREGVQNVAQNIEPTFYLNPSPIEIENGRRFNILRLIIILTPSTLRIGYWRPEFNRSQR